MIGRGQAADVGMEWDSFVESSSSRTRMRKGRTKLLRRDIGTDRLPNTHGNFRIRSVCLFAVTFLTG